MWQIIMYCENITNRGALICVDLGVHLNHENPTKYDLPINCWL
jgi:hypothetical protein